MVVEDHELRETYLESIKLVNFLSFEDQTISFLNKDGSPANFCVLTGPNGAGKTSVFQALKFVLGSNSKDGRYNKWDGFINKGKDFMKVRVKFGFHEGSGHLEIERYHRRGHNSKFYINGKHAQAQQVLKVVNGINIDPNNILQFVVQGHVNAINNLSPDEIYNLIESGIGLKTTRDEINADLKKIEGLQKDINGFKVKKDFCMKQDRMLREKLELLYQKRGLEKELVQLRAEKSWALKIDISKKIDEKARERDEIHARNEKLYEEIGKHGDEIRSLKALQEKYEKNILNAKKEMTEAKVLHRAIEDQIKSSLAEKKGLHDKNKEMQARKVEIEGYIQSIESDLADLENQKKELLVELESKQMDQVSLNQKSRELNDTLQQHAIWNNEYDRLKGEYNELKSSLKSYEALLESNKKSIKEAMHEYQEIIKELSMYKWYNEQDVDVDPKEVIEAELQEISRKISEKETLLEKRKRKEVELRRALNRSLNKVNEISVLQEGINKLQQEIAARDLEDKIRGPIYKFLKFKPDHARAIDSVFKNNGLLGFVVFDDYDFKILNKLRKKFNARCNIYHPKKNVRVKKRVLLSKKAGVIDYLVNLIDAPDWLVPIINEIARDRILVEDFSSAVSLLNEDDRAKCVTLDGTQVSGGDYTMYSPPKFTGASVLISSQNSDDGIEVRLNKIISSNEKIENEIADLKKLKNEKQFKLRQIERVKIFLNQKHAYGKKIERLNKKKEEYRQEIELIRGKITEMLLKIEDHKKKPGGKFVDLIDRMNEIREQQTEVQNIINQLNSQISEKDKEVYELSFELEKKKADLKKVKEEHDKLKESIIKLKKDYNQIEGKRRSIEKKIKIFEELINEKEKEIEKIRDALKKENECIEDLNSQVKSNEIYLEKVEQEIFKLEQQREVIEKMIKNNVKPENLKSVEEYDLMIQKIVDRLESVEFLYINDNIEKEYNENQNELKNIEEKIEEITDEMTKIVNKSEDLKNDYFQRLKSFISELTGRINDKFESLEFPFRVDLDFSGTFQSPSLKIKVDFFYGTPDEMATLSEGQKSIIALALMLTLQDINPGPICVFDEAHIFLDDFNKELISRLIKKTTEKIQLIMLVPSTFHAFIGFADKIIAIVRQGLRFKGEDPGDGKKVKKKLGPSVVIENVEELINVQAEIQ
ncbi:MAG: AAA family ATPase [Promethearchaeota archaeon]